MPQSFSQKFVHSLQHRGIVAWLLAVVLSAFYTCIYWFPHYLQGFIAWFNPLSEYLRHRPADNWFLYGSLYTLAVLVFGVRFLIKYRHSRYQIFRTLSLLFFQLIFAYLLPAFMALMAQPEFYFTYFFPLDSYVLRPENVANLLHTPHGTGIFFLAISVFLSFIATPVLTYFFGKRWYCSWVCGCGALAETAGDSFRHLSDKSLRAWKIERWTVYSVLVLVILLTLILWINSLSGGSFLGDFSSQFARAYGFFITAMFSGVVGVGFYPLLGSRVWCRFGCPMAAYLGILQKYFSRFKISTNAAQCISCGLCSHNCEMGIDVRAYAQQQQDIVRASCVGCGICAEVCPRGVLRLENISSSK
ncbi:MAG: 4Fe-4S binding protein [Bacteroidetes bacterium]|nr:4Fe-4S binding protein [Bacteroidota bacterium]MCB9043373.1 4Fe-4S binding protein [Chitinophagales bacterium]